MFANERYEYILNLLERKNSLTVSELMEAFGVTFETVRRDLAYLEKKNLLTRVHGGAVKINDIMKDFSDLTHRQVKNREQKYSLSKRAAEFVEENEIIALDAGSTANEFIKVLCETRRMLTIITYSKDIIDYATVNSNFKIICIGGEYLPSERLYKGHVAEESIYKFHVAKSFLFPASVSLKYGISLNLSDVYNLNKALLHICQQSFVLADSTKLETVSPIKVCNIDDVDMIVTDPLIDELTLKRYREKKLYIVI